MAQSSLGETAGKRRALSRWPDSGASLAAGTMVEMMGLETCPSRALICAGPSVWHGTSCFRCIRPYAVWVRTRRPCPRVHHIIGVHCGLRAAHAAAAPSDVLSRNRKRVSATHPPGPVFAAPRAVHERRHRRQVRPSWPALFVPSREVTAEWVRHFRRRRSQPPACTTGRCRLRTADTQNSGGGKRSPVVTLPDSFRPPYS